MPADLDGPEEDLARTLSGVDTVVSAVDPFNFDCQVVLARAAKAAGVKRFIPCNFGPATPVGGILWLRDKVLLPVGGFLLYTMSN